MANYSLVSDNIYNPFTFDELLKPYQIYGAAYKEQEDKYNQLAEDSSKWGDLLDPNSEAYKMWSSFLGDMGNAVSSLTTEGLTPNVRALMSKVRQSYGKNIKAIEAADIKYLLAKALRALVYGNDDSVEYKKELSIDDFLHGKEGSLEHISGEKLRVLTGDLASKLGKAIYSNPSFNEVMGGYYYLITLHTGATPELIRSIVEREDYKKFHHENPTTKEEKNEEKLYLDMKAFDDLYTSLVKKTKGYSPESAARLLEKVYEGLYAGLDAPTSTFVDNRGKMSAAEVADNAIKWATFKHTVADDREKNALTRSAQIIGHKEFLISDTTENKKLKEQARQFDITNGIDPKTGLLTGTQKGKVAKYQGVLYTYDGDTSVFDKVSDLPRLRGKSVTVRSCGLGDPHAGSIEVSFKGKVIGYYELSKHEFNKELFDTKTFDNYFGGAYCKKDLTTLEKLCEHAANIEDAGDAVSNYSWYFEPDNAKINNDNGSFTSVPLDIKDPTSNNSVLKK